MQTNYLKNCLINIFIISGSVLISSPILAQYSRGYTLFQPGSFRYQSGDDTTAADYLAKNKNGQNFRVLLEKAGLMPSLQQKGPMTILVPTEAALKAIPKETLNDLQKPENQEILRKILGYHIIIGEVKQEIIDRGGGMLPTMQGENIQLVINSNNGIIRLNESLALGERSVKTGNAIIISIDRLLIPPSIAAKITFQGLSNNYKTPPSPQPSLLPSPQPSATSSTTNLPRLRGFICDVNTMETKLFKANGEEQIWIRWRSQAFTNSGYDPLRRCQEVSSRLETYRVNQQLNFITLGKINGQNAICTANQPGVCTNLIYTLQPDERDPIGALQAFLAWRTQSANAVTRYESRDDAPPLIDVREALREEPNPTQPPLSPPKSGEGNMPDL